MPTGLAYVSGWSGRGSKVARARCRRLFDGSAASKRVASALATLFAARATRPGGQFDRFQLREIGMKVVNDQVLRIQMPTITETVEAGQVLSGLRIGGLETAVLGFDLQRLCIEILAACRV